MRVKFKRATMEGTKGGKWSVGVEALAVVGDDGDAIYAGMEVNSLVPEEPNGRQSEDIAERGKELCDALILDADPSLVVFDSRKVL
jgi:hypothetical protein